MIFSPLNSEFHVLLHAPLKSQRFARAVHTQMCLYTLWFVLFDMHFCGDEKTLISGTDCFHVFEPIQNCLNQSHPTSERIQGQCGMPRGALRGALYAVLNIFCPLSYQVC